MRINFAKLYKMEHAKRYTFIATFVRFGKKSGYKGYIAVTLLLSDIKSIENQDVIIENHVWMNLGKRFGKTNLKCGDIIQFNARVGIYQKGYSEDDEDNPFRFDYRLEYPTKIQIIDHDSTFDQEQDSCDKIVNQIEHHNVSLQESRANFLKRDDDHFVIEYIHIEQKDKTTRESTNQKTLESYLI